MVIEPKQTMLAYRCPVCGKGVVSAVGMFSLKADMLKLKCECGESALTVNMTHDDKIRLNVPCMICPTGHNYTVSKSIFFGRELFMLQCPYTDVNLCFMGEYDSVCRELERTELELLDMIGEENLRALGGESESETLTDPQIFDIIMFVLRELDEEGKIECHCENGHGEYEAEILDDGIRVTCTKCHASQTIPTDSHLASHAFLHCDKLVLE